MVFCMLDLSLATRWQKPHKCEPKENWYSAVILHRDVRVKVRISLDIYSRGLGNIVGEKNKYFHCISVNKVNLFNGVKLQLTWYITFK